MRWPGTQESRHSFWKAPAPSNRGEPSPPFPTKKGASEIEGALAGAEPGGPRQIRRQHLDSTSVEQPQTGPAILEAPAKKRRLDSQRRCSIPLSAACTPCYSVGKEIEQRDRAKRSSKEIEQKQRAASAWPQARRWPPPRPVLSVVRKINQPLSPLPKEKHLVDATNC